MKSLFPHTEHNAIKRILSLLLLLSLEFSTFAHAGMLAIMPIERQWLSATQNPSILDLFRSTTSVVPVVTGSTPQRVIYTAPKTIKKVATSIAIPIQKLTSSDGWLNANHFVASNRVPPMTQAAGSGVTILMRDASGRITSMPLADLYTTPSTFANVPSQISIPILS